MQNVPELIEKIIAGIDLSESEARSAMSLILSGGMPPAQAAAFLTALRCKPESETEVTGFARAMRAAMQTVSVNQAIVADTCGTGGDSKGTFNISTAAAFVAAGAGVPVAKHGNRSISSRCGSADILEAAGVKIDMSRENAERCLRGIGITFLFAPLYHPAMKNAAPIRKELGIRTVFNILGPLANPAGANAQVIGVPKKELVPFMARVLQKLQAGKKGRTLVIHEAGYDEMVLAGSCSVAEVSGGKVRRYTLSPSDLKLKKADPKVLKGGNADENAVILREILSDKGLSLTEVVVANAALVLYAAGKTKGGFAEAAGLARKTIASGAALAKLNQLCEWSRKNG